MDKDDLKSRTKAFAHRCVKLAVSLTNNDLGNHIKKQLIRCSTSVAANYRAACHGHTRAAFIHKMVSLLKKLMNRNSGSILSLMKILSQSP